ncbi:MAG: DUF4982 domain-containing protein [Chitinispirillaceae bacterium]|nr:DUF4982 domain-containing protein [Chitinispirillaceae bacterium]
MKPGWWEPFIMIVLAVAAGSSSAPDNAGRIPINLNSGWLFQRGDSAGAQLSHRNESGWKRICLPHANMIVNHTDIDTSCFAFVSWYRKHLTLPRAYAGRRFIIEFEAVSKAAEVYVNGERVGAHKGAYTPFSFDITGHLAVEKDNVLAVRVDSRQRKDIPPEGKNLDFMVFGGIVRDVYLTVVDPLHVEWVYVRKDSGKDTRLLVETMLANDSSAQRGCYVATLLVDAAGSVVARAGDSVTIAAHSRKTFLWTIGPLANPHTWHPDDPYLYTVRSEVAENGRQVDRHQFRFGIRDFSFSKTTGAFSVNGKPFKLRGLNRHETFPFIGRAAANRLQARDADIVKYDFGCNIVRCSHYPQDPAFLDRCDEIGLLVLEEMAGWVYVSDDTAWQSIALCNLEEMIVRDRNRASIVSFGVRINQSADIHDFYTKTNRLAHRLDPSRPTHGARVLDRGSPEEFMEGIWTQNYLIPDSTPPVLPWITTESVGHWFPAHSWDNTGWLCGHALVHAAMLDSAFENPAIAGIAGWCAFDYHSPYRYAEQSVCYHGVADIFRQPKPAAYVYRSQQEPGPYGPMVHILHDWSSPVSQNDVWVASNCDSVELFVNGRSQGKRAPSRYRSLPHPLYVWKAVPFVKGEIGAHGFIEGKKAATAVRTIPGRPVRLAVVPDDTVLDAGGDMTRVVVTVKDSNGQTVPRLRDSVTITVRGRGLFCGKSPIALENGATAFFVQTGGVAGNIRCRVNHEKLKAAEAVITVLPEAGTKK